MGTTFFRRARARRRSIVAAAAFLCGAGLIQIQPAAASHPEVSLAGSDFEIDTDANLKADDDAPSIDWGSVDETRKADLASGSGDDSFGQGTKEDDAVPVVVDGSIPPNKSDLLNFGVYLETTASGARFLNLFWHRVQEPQGTTNMDFEFNQSDVLSGNGVTPVRTSGDLLIQYDLSQGGTNPQLFLSRWIDGSEGATADDCNSANQLPCWDTRINLSAAGDATGSINSTAIPVGDSDGLAIDLDDDGDLDPVSPRTFGEAQLDFDALVGGADECVAFGSAYLKSRSSDSFTSALKDFIAPEALDLNQCATVIIRKQTDPEEDPNTTTFGYTKTFPTDPATDPTFTLTDDGVQTYDNIVLPGTGLTVVEDVIPAGWDFAGVNCDASSGVTPSINGATVTFDIDANTDVLDCTYTNRARADLHIVKVAERDGVDFPFVADPPLDPANFTLQDGGQQDYLDLLPDTYGVNETPVPAGWNLESATCDNGDSPAAVTLGPGDDVTCTFTNVIERGAVLIHKVRKHAADGPGDHPHAGVDFTVTNSTNGTNEVVTTDADGFACVDDVPVSSLDGDYTITETVPLGYHGDSAPRAYTVVESDCTTALAAEFVNTPLTNITVSVNSQVDGGTASTIDCVLASGGTDPDGDGSLTLNDLQPGTYTCTVVIDP